MGRKKKKIEKPWCWYCNREFEDDKILIQHQKAKHFKCHICHKKLFSGPGLAIHCIQVHKESISKIPCALPGRDSTETEIYGMEGIPEGAYRGLFQEEEEPPYKAPRTDVGPTVSTGIPTQFPPYSSGYGAGSPFGPPSGPPMPPGYPPNPVMSQHGFHGGPPAPFVAPQRPSFGTYTFQPSSRPIPPPQRIHPTNRIESYRDNFSEYADPYDSKHIEPAKHLNSGISSLQFQSTTNDRTTFLYDERSISLPKGNNYATQPADGIHPVKAVSGKTKIIHPDDYTLSLEERHLMILGGPWR